MKLVAVLVILAALSFIRGSIVPERREEPLGPVAAGLSIALSIALALGLLGGAAWWISDLEPFWQAAAITSICGVSFFGAIAWALWSRGVREREAARRSLPVDQWRRAGLGVQPSQGVVGFADGQRCPMCKLEHKPSSDAAECPACKALFHLACALDLGRCSTLGCEGKPTRVDAVHVERLASPDAAPAPSTAFDPVRRPEGRRGPPAR